MAAVLWASLLAAGCREPRSATADLQPAPGEERLKAELTAPEQSRALAAMRSVAQGHVPVDPPRPAPPESGGMRFGDVRAAVGAACGDIEAAVVAETESDDGAEIRFRLRTIEDWPGELVVRRAPAPTVYEAEAWIGRFPDEPSRVARAEALRAALAKRMRDLGRKPGFNR